MNQQQQHDHFGDVIAHELMARIDQDIRIIKKREAERDYWKERCEAAEKVISISGVVACEGFGHWQLLIKLQNNNNGK